MLKRNVTFLAVLLATSAAIAAPASAPANKPMTLKVTGIENGKFIPERFAYCVPDGKGAARDGSNISPEIQWSNAPEGTRSFALMVVDKDVPATFDDANKPDKTIAENEPRQNFYHWVLVDIPVNMFGFPEGKASLGITQGGKFLGRTEYGINGQNDYAKVFGGYGESGWGGYDGPCPPWNDLRLHNYHFIIYALDTESLGLQGAFVGQQLEDAMKGHILAQAEVVGQLSNNVRIRSYYGK